MTQKPVSARNPSNAPATFDDQSPVTPTVTLDLDGERIQAVFATDDAVNAFVSSLQGSARRFVAVKNEDGELRFLNPEYVKEFHVSAVAHPPEPALRKATLGEWVGLAGSNLKAARLGENDTMIAEFADGSRYEYSGVDAETFGELINAPSAGKQYDRSIRGKYAERQLPNA